MFLPSIQILILIAFFFWLVGFVFRNFGKIFLLVIGVFIGLVLVAANSGCTPSSHDAAPESTDTPADVSDGLVELPQASALAGEIPGITELVLPTPTPTPIPVPTVAPAPEVTPVPESTQVPESTPEPPPPEPTPTVVYCSSWRIDGILFESGSASLTAEAHGSFEALVAQIPADAEVTLIGHTDDIPIAMGNQKLSELRARAAADALAQAGLRPDQIISVDGKGDTQPAASNDTAEGRRQNRRVEVLVSCPELSQ